ncbi:hypothetical protein EB155_07955, partial [archaeon]|nr:hypothetical protein [archaeon]
VSKSKEKERNTVHEVAVLEGFGDPIVEVNEEEYQEKIKKLSPFDFANAITSTKEDLMAEDENIEPQYNAFIVNRALGYGADTVIAGNEMNARPHIDARMQFEFLRGVVRQSRRFNKWIKGEHENIKLIQEEFGYSFNKAKEALRLLSETDLQNISKYRDAKYGGKNLAKKTPK